MNSPCEIGTLETATSLSQKLKYLEHNECNPNSRIFEQTRRAQNRNKTPVKPRRNIQKARTFTFRENKPVFSHPTKKFLTKVNTWEEPKRRNIMEEMFIRTENSDDSSAIEQEDEFSDSSSEFSIIVKRVNPKEIPEEEKGIAKPIFSGLKLKLNSYSFEDEQKVGRLYNKFKQKYKHDTHNPRLLYEDLKQECLPYQRREGFGDYVRYRLVEDFAFKHDWKSYA